MTGSPAWRAARMRAGSRSRAMYSNPCDSSTRATFCPTRPKPHRITWSRAAISRVAASSRSLAVSGGPRSPRSRRATRLLLFRMAGLSTIDSTSATSRGWPMAAGRSPDCNAIVHSATPNSPPIEITTPVRNALNRVVVNGRVTRAATVPLMITSPSNIAETTPIPLTRIRTSSSMPTEMKKMPSRMSRNGRITASI